MRTLHTHEISEVAGAALTAYTYHQAITSIAATVLVAEKLVSQRFGAVIGVAGLAGAFLNENPEYAAVIADCASNGIPKISNLFHYYFIPGENNANAQ